MPRVKRAVNSHKSKKKIMKMAKGFSGTRQRNYRKAKEAVVHALAYSFRDRRNKKREFRRLFITRVNAAARTNGISYSQLMNGLKKAGVDINRKMLSEIAISDPQGFTEMTNVAKAQLAIA